MTKNLAPSAKIEPPPFQYRCLMCGDHFLLRASLFRHQRPEIEEFQTDHAKRRLAYVEERQVWRADHPHLFHEKVLGRTPH